jgi:hypothetical protein
MSEKVEVKVEAEDKRPIIEQAQLMAIRLSTAAQAHIAGVPIEDLTGDPLWAEAIRHDAHTRRMVERVTPPRQYPPARPLTRGEAFEIAFCGSLTSSLTLPLVGGGKRKRAWRG